IELAEHFKVPAMVCVNKFDLNPEQTQAIEDMVKKKNMTFLGKIPFDPAFTKSMVQGKTITEYDRDSEVNRAVEDVWNKIVTSPEMAHDA
ncbi:MAG: (4Fe-4S)-binding protein, partial [Deltaproteobacteria bacterium]|nr:(4Fe-4S)-binding protein [Deltaproteobacteria bacterium]